MATLLARRRSLPRASLPAALAQHPAAIHVLHRALPLPRRAHAPPWIHAGTDFFTIFFSYKNPVSL